jgi:hypothetical protein
MVFNLIVIHVNLLMDSNLSIRLFRLVRFGMVIQQKYVRLNSGSFLTSLAQVELKLGQA